MPKGKSIHLEIAETLKKRIETGTYKPGEQLPSRKKLASEFKVHLNTLKEAFRVLREKGLIGSSPGACVHALGKTSRPRKLALLLPPGPGLADILLGIDETLKGNDSAVDLMIYRSPAEYVQCLKRLRDKNFTGAIARPDSSGEGYGVEQQLKEDKFPFVLIENFYPESDGWHVDAGAFEAAGLAVRHLKSISWLPAGIVSSNDNFGRAFAEGYKQALFALKESCFRENIKFLERGLLPENASMDFFKMKNPPRSIIYINPDDAVSSYKAIKDSGRDLKNIKIVSFGEPANNGLFGYPVTFIKRDFKALGARAAKLLLEQIETAPHQVRRRIEKIQVELKS